MRKYGSLLLCSFFIYSCTNSDSSKPNVTHTNTVIAKKKIPESIATLINAAQKDSNNKELQMQVIDALDSATFYKEALQYLNKLIVKDSLNAAYWQKHGQINKNLPDTAAAIKDFIYAARIYPSAITLQELANLFAETKNPATLKICEQLMKDNPAGNYNAQALFFMGVYFSKLNNVEKALTLFSNSINENPHFADAYIEKGYILFNQKKYAEALKNFEQLNSFNQTNADGYYWQAKCYKALGNKQQAIMFYKKCLQLDNSIAEATQALQELEAS